MFYCVTGALALVGERAGTSGTTTPAGALIKSNAGKLGFKISVMNESGTEVESVDFNFSRNNNGYIRNVFNTNPQLTNSTTISSEDRKTYWLGESFIDHLHNSANKDAVAGDAYGILLPLGNGNWSLLTGVIKDMVREKQNLVGYFRSFNKSTKNFSALNHCMLEKKFKEII